jgi:hypothetical protein
MGTKRIEIESAFELLVRSRVVSALLGSVFVNRILVKRAYQRHSLNRMSTVTRLVVMRLN